MIPQCDAVSLPLLLPSPRSPPQQNANPLSIIKSAVKSLIPKSLCHILRRRNRHRDLPCYYPPQLLQTFPRITHLHLDIRIQSRSFNVEFLKWNVTYGAQIKSCFIRCATSICRGTVDEPDVDDGELMSLISNLELRTRSIWSMARLIAASARHDIVKKMLPQFSTLTTVLITDAKRQGRFSMEEAEIGELRDSLNNDAFSLMPPNARVVSDLRLKFLHVAELELPATGLVMEEAMMVMIGPKAHEEVEPPSAVDGGFDCDAVEKVMVGEAVREIVKRKKKGTYVLEAPAF